MELKLLLDRIMKADRLETIAAVKEEMFVYIANHPETQDLAHPIYTAAGAMKRTEYCLTSMQESGVDLEKYYRERDEEWKRIFDEYNLDY